MAEGHFVSKYTGADIEQAIGAYLNGNTKTTVIVNVLATSTYWKTNTSTSSSPKYYMEIMLDNAFYVGNYPDIFIVDNSGVKIIPDVDYSNVAVNKTFKVYSNTMVNGVVVINGTKTTLKKTT